VRLRKRRKVREGDKRNVPANLTGDDLALINLGGGKSGQEGLRGAENTGRGQTSASPVGTSLGGYREKDQLGALVPPITGERERSEG